MRFWSRLRPSPAAIGVAHILEHTALCGSENFPVRDPFFGMLKRSLQTFMNVYGVDWTRTVATQNPKDFDNLLQVYLDAAFSRSSGAGLCAEGIVSNSKTRMTWLQIILKIVVYNG